MLEYTYEEALELLTNNLANAIETVDSLDTDLDFIKDQITTTEVNIARVYNNGETPDWNSLLFCHFSPSLGINSCVTDVREKRKAQNADAAK